MENRHRPGYATTFTAQANEAHHQDASAAVVTKKAAKPAAKPMAASKEMEAQMEKMNAVHAKMAAAKTLKNGKPPCRKEWRHEGQHGHDEANAHGALSGRHVQYGHEEGDEAK
jgi:hypothetical protein